MSTFQWSQCGILALTDTLIVIFTLGKGRKRDVKNAKENDDLWVRSLSVNVLTMRSVCKPSLTSAVPRLTHDGVGTLCNKLLTEHARMQSLLATSVQCKFHAFSPPICTWLIWLGVRYPLESVAFNLYIQWK